MSLGLAVSSEPELNPLANKYTELLTPLALKRIAIFLNSNKILFVLDLD